MPDRRSRARCDPHTTATSPPSGDGAHFIAGAELCGALYTHGVLPILERHWPDLPHSAALLGPGSEVLGYDDITSTDHDWGPRLTLFLSEDALADHAASIHEALGAELPPVIHGYSTSFTSPEAAADGVRHMELVPEGSVQHGVAIQSVGGFFRDLLDCDLNQPIPPSAWLTFSEQQLRSVTHGSVYRDEVGLGQARAQLAWYPRDLWLYLLASGWNRLSQEEHLMGRAGSVGDEVGSAIIGSRLARDVMRLCFLMERVYAPYPKWFGTAFAQLACAESLLPSLQAALATNIWQERERHLVVAYEHVAAMHNRLELTAPLPERVMRFHGRPFLVIAQHGFAEALVEQIGDPAIRRIASRRLIGGVDQFSDSTDLIGTPCWRPALRALYE